MNVDRFRKVYDRVELVERMGETLEGWNQHHWGQRIVFEGGGCRTTYCWAGWTCVLAGDEMIFERRDGDFAEYAENVLTPDGRQVDIEERARELLELDRAQAGRLFYSDNDLEQIRNLGRMYGADL